MARTTFPRTTFPRKLERRERGPGLGDEARSSAGWPIKLSANLPRRSFVRDGADLTARLV